MRAAEHRPASNRTTAPARSTRPGGRAARAHPAREARRRLQTALRPTAQDQRPSARRPPAGVRSWVRKRSPARGPACRQAEPAGSNAGGHRRQNIGQDDAAACSNFEALSRPSGGARSASVSRLCNGASARRRTSDGCAQQLTIMVALGVDQRFSCHATGGAPSARASVARTSDRPPARTRKRSHASPARAQPHDAAQARTGQFTAIAKPAARAALR